jgi:hypothetical protein
MTLVEERDAWREEFIRGHVLDSSYIDTYTLNRDNSLWRGTIHMEMMCEYILYLEAKAGVVR